VAGIINYAHLFQQDIFSAEKTLVENTNQRIRQYFSKETDLRTVTNVQIKKALAWINERPRECLDWMIAVLCVKQ